MDRSLAPLSPSPRPPELVALARMRAALEEGDLRRAQAVVMALPPDVADRVLLRLRRQVQWAVNRAR